MKLLAWLFLIVGSFFIGVGQKLSAEAYDQWSELVAEEMLKK